MNDCPIHERKQEARFVKLVLRNKTNEIMLRRLAELCLPAGRVFGFRVSLSIGVEWSVR